MAAAAALRPGSVAEVRARREADGLARGLGRTHIAQIQRARILAATIDVVAHGGVANVTVAHVVARSGVSRRTFYEIFSDSDDCLLAAFQDTLGRAVERVLPAYEAGRGWRERLRAGLTALLAFLDEEPAAARLLVNESLAAGGSVGERRGEIVAQLVAAVDAGRAETKGGGQLPPLTAEGAVGGALSIVGRLIASPDHDLLVELVNPLMGLIVLPYLGFAASQRELDRPVVAPASAPVEPPADPFKPAGLRLTYRTVRVLLAVAENPGASNRTVGEVAEIRDQGQMSKLLGRLRRLGLIENTGLAPGQGAPNAWTLTPSGQQMANSIRSHTERVTRADEGAAE
jgi:AcrR family transcriptional regulator/DNA-binding MarR family transcriptional regulator